MSKLWKIQRAGKVVIYRGLFVYRPQVSLDLMLAKFMDKYPDIVISLNITERYVDLIEERVDLMFFTGQLKDNNLVTQQIGEVKAVV